MGVAVFPIIKDMILPEVSEKSLFLFSWRGREKQEEIPLKPKKGLEEVVKTPEDIAALYHITCPIFFFLPVTRTC